MNNVNSAKTIEAKVVKFIFQNSFDKHFISQKVITRFHDIRSSQLQNKLERKFSQCIDCYQRKGSVLESVTVLPRSRMMTVTFAIL